MIGFLWAFASQKGGAAQVVSSKFQSATLADHHVGMKGSDRVPQSDFDTVIGFSTAGTAGEAVNTLTRFESGACRSVPGQFDLGGMTAAKGAAIVKRPSTGLAFLVSSGRNYCGDT